MKKALFYLLLLVLSPIAVLIVTTPMDSQKQYIFGLISIGVLFLLGFSKKHSISVIMMIVAVLMSTRYIYFRATQTLHFNSEIEAILGIGLFLAELYIWITIMLSYLQNLFPLKRTIVPLPDDTSLWPTVDVYIPSYNESLEVVRDTVLAAQCLDYPISSKSTCSTMANAASLRSSPQTSAWATSLVRITFMPKRATLITP